MATVNLRRLRYFVAVADELHFGRAARRLHMAQPPLSQQIRQLEAELGVTLFLRSTRRVTLTDEGRLFYPEAVRLLAEADSVERRVAEIRSGDGGTLRLGFVDSASYEVLPRFLRAYRTRWPAVEYELRSMSSDEQHEALLGRRIDLGIGRAAGADGEITATTILEERLAVGLPADHDLAGRAGSGLADPAGSGHADHDLAGQAASGRAGRAGTSLAELAGETFIGFDRRVSPSLHAELQALFTEAGVDYDPIIEATEYTTILGLVASGQGIAVVPAGVQSFRPPSLAYLALRDDGATSNLLMLHRTGERSPVVARAIEVATDVFDDTGRSGGT